MHVTYVSNYAIQHRDNGKIFPFVCVLNDGSVARIRCNRNWRFGNPDIPKEKDCLCKTHYPYEILQMDHPEFAYTLAEATVRVAGFRLVSEDEQYPYIPRAFARIYKYACSLMPLTQEEIDKLFILKKGKKYKK